MLFCRLEALPDVQIHPFGRFFDFVEAKGVLLESSTNPQCVHTSWLFIGLCFTVPEEVPTTGATHSVDLTSVIRDFAFYTDQWEARDGGMDMQIDHVTRSEVPEWVLEAMSGNPDSDSKHLQRRVPALVLSKKKKRDDAGDASDCHGGANGSTGTAVGSSPTRSSSKKSKGT